MLKFCPGAGVRSAKYEVNPGSKAAQKGVREGDVISSINGQPTKHVTNSAAHSLLRNAGHTLRLGLNQENCGSPKRRGHKSSQSADLEQQSARSEERTSRGRNDEEVCVEAGEGVSKDPATSSQGQQQSTAMVGNSRSRRRKRARANRLKNQGGERPEMSELASEEQFVTADSSEAKTEVQQSESTGECFEEGVPEMALAEETSTFPLLRDAEDGPTYGLNSDHGNTSVEASSKSIYSESSCGSRTETVSSYLSIVYTSACDYENQNTGSVTAVDDNIKTIPCDNMQLQLNVFSSNNDAASCGNMDIENDSESEQNSRLFGLIHENDGHDCSETAIIGNEGAKKQESHQNIIVFEDKSSSLTDISEGHSATNNFEANGSQSTDTVKEHLGTDVEKMFIQQNVNKVEIKERKAKQEHYSNILVTEEHSIDCETNESGLLQNDLVVNTLAVTDFTGNIPSPNGTGEEASFVDNLNLHCPSENVTNGKHAELSGLLGKCSSYEDFSADHIIDTGDMKSSTCETKMEDNSICRVVEPRGLCLNETEEEHNFDTKTKCDNAHSFENHFSVGQIISTDEVRNIPYGIEEEATVSGEAELNNYFQVHNEDKRTVDFRSEVDGSFQGTSAVLCITDTYVAHCHNVSEEKIIQPDPGQDQKLCEDGRETFENNVVSLREINADTNKTISDQECNERKIAIKETEDQDSNGKEYVAPNMCDDKGAFQNNAETEHTPCTDIVKAGFCQNETKENLNKPEQEIFHNEIRGEQILDNISDAQVHQDHCSSTCIVTTKAVFCGNETQEKGTTPSTPGEQEGCGIELGSEHKIIAVTKSTRFCETNTGRNMSCESSEEQVVCQNENAIHGTDVKCVEQGPLHTMTNEINIVDSVNMDFYQYSDILEKSVDIKTDCRDTFQKQITQGNENGIKLGISSSQNEFREERQHVDNIELENTLEAESMENSGHVNKKSFGTAMKVSDCDDNLEALQRDSKGKTSQEFIAPAKNERTKINTSEKLDPLQMQKVNEWRAEGEVTAERDSSSVSVSTSELFEDRTNFQKEHCISEIVSTVETHGESRPPELLAETGSLKFSESNMMDSHNCESDTSNDAACKEDNFVASGGNFHCIDSHKYATLSSEENNMNNAGSSIHFTEVFENKLNEVEWETTIENGKIGATEVEPLCSPCFALKTSTVSLQQDTSSGDSKTPEKNVHMQTEDDALNIRKNLHVDGSKESVSSKRFRTRQILESFFMPSNHQRYLDVIVEEGGESNEEREAPERNSLRPQSTEKTDKAEDSSPQLVICKKYSGDVFTWSCSRHSKDECNSKNSKHSIVWEKNYNKTAKVTTFPQQNIGCDAEVENVSDEELILKRGKTQEAEENAEVVFLEDTSSTSSMTIQGDDPGDDADIEEMELEFRDYGADDKIRTPTTCFDDPIYENIMVFRKSNGAEDFKGHSSTNGDLHSRMNSGEQFVHCKPNYMHASNLQGTNNISVSGHSLIADVNASMAKQMGAVKKCCDVKNDEDSSSDAHGTNFNRAGITTDDITNKGSHSEKIVDFFKHLFISLPETDVRRRNVHEALMELICDASSPLSPVTRNSLEIFLSDESFNTSEGHVAYKDQTSGEYATDISSVVKDCTSTNNLLNSHQTNLECQISSETDVPNPENGSTEPKSLKDLALDRILSLPYGTEILICLGIKGIHMYSQNISVGREQRRCSKSVVPRASPHVININQRVPIREQSESTWNDDTDIHDCHDEEHSCTPVASESCGQEWVGMPTSLDPHLLVCMSPAQARGYRGHYMLPTPEEAQSLLDLHQKYLERHCYHDKRASSRHVAQVQTPPFADGAEEHRRDSTHRKQDDGEPAFIVNPSREKECVTSRAVKIPAEEGEGARVGEMESSRLLAIIRESSPRRAPSCQQTPAGMEPTVVVARTPKAANRHSWGGPQLDRPAEKRSSAFLDSLDDSLRLSDDSRLKAKLLSEWMSLARERGGGSSASRYGDAHREETDTRAPWKENGHEGPPSKEEQRVSSGARRYSLPEPGDQPCQPPQLARQVSAPGEPRRFDPEQYIISKRGDIAIIQSEARPGRAKAPAASGGDGEIFRQQMYLEYMSKVEERKERRRQKVIRISAAAPSVLAEQDQGRPRLQSEFMGRVRERMDKLGLDYGGEESRADVPHLLPSHLHEFLVSEDEGVWSPAQKDKEAEPQREQEVPAPSRGQNDTTPPSAAVWTPRSAGSSPVAERKEFRPVKFQSPTLPRKSIDPPASEQMKQEEVKTQQQSSSESPAVTSLDLPSSRLVQSHSAPASGLSSLVSLPRAQNPTITLLQKAREGQLPKGALYLENNSNNNEDKSSMNPNDILFQVKREYETDTDGGHKKVTELTPKKYDGIGPMTREGIPLVLRSEIKETNQAKWYKRMYDSLHRASKDDDYVTVRYRPSRGSLPSQHASPGGYMSEPDRSGYYSDVGYSAKYATLDRRRIKNKENDFTTNTLPRSKYLPHPNSVKCYPEVYRNQPGRIEDYVPGRSSISDKETKQWWDEVLEIFDSEKQDGYKVPVSLPGNSFLNRAVKVSGYDSDSTLVFKRRDENLQNQLSPAEQKMAYKTIQKGGEVPLHGLRKPAPERPKEPVNGAVPGKSHTGDRPQESPHRYVESEVTIHYRSPVRSEAKQAVSEEELARRQAEAMRRIYQEERRRKYLQELQDMNSRRHTDNFTPSQKSPIPLNRYDDILDDVSKTKPRDRTPEPKLVARALYNFVGQTSRELSFRRGDIIFVKRQIDKNWYEGEHNAMVGLFPLNYVEIIPYDGIRTMPKRPSEGQARAKFNFTAQTYLELPLVKGELVVLTRRVDDNWYEGRIGSRKGIFPVSYVEVLQEPGMGDRPTSRAVSSPASQMVMVNGSRGGRPATYQPGSYYGHSKGVTGHYATLPRQGPAGKPQPSAMNQTLHIDTRSEPVPYRALYNYCPQNDDELELMEGDLVYVMEKCDDGWYVGSSQRTGYFGTFPGNYVERI